MKKNKIFNYLSIFIFVSAFFVCAKIVYASLSCSVTTAAACTGTVLLRMSNSENAHAELPSQSNAAYANNVVCCSGVAGLGNSCSGNYKVIARLSGATNAHVEKNTETTATYPQNACISSSFGDIISVGYQATNCTGYSTTLASMSQATTNAHVGNTTAYPNKICADIFSQSITFNISTSSVGFGQLTPTGIRYATSNGVGSTSETESFNISASTNAPSGYFIYMKGDSLSKNSSVINPIGGTNTTPTAGTKQFGMRAVASGGSGSVVAPHDGAGFAYDATGTSFTTVAQSSTGDGVTTTYSIRTVATIDSLLDPGNYSTSITYVVVGGF